MNCFQSQYFSSHHVMQSTLSPLMFETTQWPGKSLNLYQTMLHHIP